MTGSGDADAAPMLRILAALCLLSAMTVAGCSSGGGHGTVTVKDDEFDPKTLTVDAGEEVHFEVTGSKAHTITIHKAGDPTTTLLKDVEVNKGDDEHFTFATAGTYHVWCTKHGGMTSGMSMVVTVE